MVLPLAYSPFCLPTWSSSLSFLYSKGQTNPSVGWRQARSIPCFLSPPSNYLTQTQIKNVPSNTLLLRCPITLPFNPMSGAKNRGKRDATSSPPSRAGLVPGIFSPCIEQKRKLRPRENLEPVSLNRSNRREGPRDSLSLLTCQIYT